MALFPKISPPTLPLYRLFGRISQYSRHAEIFYFPTPFPHKCVAITGSPDTYDHELNWSIIKRNNESFYMYMDNGGNYTFSWIAIGY